MMRLTIALVLLYLHATIAHSFAWYPKPLTREFCSNPPLEDVNWERYLGTWYQLYVNPRALRFSSTTCVTANYTALPGGNIRVRNCLDKNGATSCSDAAAKRTQTPGRLSVRFGPLPPQRYSVAATLGDPAYGYFASAVYGCDVVNGRPVESWFIISRTPYISYRTFQLIARKLHYKGYDLRRTRFTGTRHGPGCNYFFGPRGYSMRRIVGRPGN